NIPLDDEATYKMLISGNTDGVFQLESSGMKKLVRELKPSVFEDLGALVALFRPGPLESGMVTDFVERKHGRQKISYAHPLLEKVLKDTYGTIVYQEQIMQVFQILADYTLGEADMVRRMMGKKKLEEMAKQKVRFVEAASKKGMTEQAADELFGQIESFAKYCFNRSHSACYAFVSYQTAYLKAHYPVEYICAMLSNSKDDLEKIQLYITEAQKNGIKVLPPDINKSNAEFTPDGNNIRFGLNSIKGIGDAVLKEIIEEHKKGEFKDIIDFTQRINPRVINRKALENFIKAGALDCLVPCRKKLLNNIDNILNTAAKEAEAKELGQVSLFSGLGTQTQASSYQLQNFELFGSDEEFLDKQIQEFEKEYLGFYVTSHPLESIRDKLPFLTTHNIIDLVNTPNDTFVTVCGLLNSVRQIPTKKDPTKFLKAGIIEDLTGELPFVAFHKTLQNYNSLIENEKKVILSGKLQKKEEDNIQLIIESVKPVENSNIVTIELKQEIPFETLIALKDNLANYKGTDPLVISADNNGEKTKVLVSSNFWLNANNDLLQSVEKNFSNIVNISVSSLE
ncbi:MAG: DNA polymerase III subunit alpha, partial [Candidatus Gastranaerophilales bacterium]|nr:DNA polymerase III subunit alpha [Candidatus Gastranaerophilales bacterium]